VRILLYNPDNGVTRNFMPHLWMFLLRALTPPGHEVLLVDGNARAMSEQELVEFAREQGIGLVGIGAMTRMIARAYRMADALRGAGIPVVMGGPHVTEVPDEALGRDGGQRHAESRMRHAVVSGKFTSPSATPRAMTVNRACNITRRSPGRRSTSISSTSSRHSRAHS
jgi:hypothetical protein